MTKKELTGLKESVLKISEMAKAIYKFAPPSEERQIIGQTTKLLDVEIAKIDFKKYLDPDAEEPISLVGQILRDRPQ